MLKNILKLNGAQSLSKTEQKAINGGSNIDCNGLDTCLQSCGSGNCEVRAPYFDPTSPIITIGQQCYVCVNDLPIYL